jgi:hypothetical protein
MSANTDEKTILDLKFRQPDQFKYFWIKYVNGFDPSKHCARCLIGEYSSLLSYRERRDLAGAVLDEHASRFIYICGVTPKWKWNVHVAGICKPGESFELQDERVELRLTNFQRIEIVPDLGPPAHRAFATCRNWQFGWTAFPHTHRQAELTL